MDRSRPIDGRWPERHGRPPKEHPMKPKLKKNVRHAAKRTSRRMAKSKKPKNPVLHHALLKTARLQEMIAWYAAVVGAEPVFEAPGIVFLSNDAANHRISMVGNPEFLANSNFRRSVGMHHLAFEYETVNDLLDTWQRLHDDYGYKPHVAVHHGMTLSFYYADPENNSVELQADVFGDWNKSKSWMRTSAQFKANPIGTFVDPAAMLAARAGGVKTTELLRRAYAGEYPPAAAYDYLVDLPAP
jgi:catechol 2,3-dioxygenase